LRLYEKKKVFDGCRDSKTDKLKTLLVERLARQINKTAQKNPQATQGWLGGLLQYTKRGIQWLGTKLWHAVQYVWSSPLLMTVLSLMTYVFRIYLCYWMGGEKIQETIPDIVAYLLTEVVGVVQTSPIYRFTLALCQVIGCSFISMSTGDVTKLLSCISEHFFGKEWTTWGVFAMLKDFVKNMAYSLLNYIAYYVIGDGEVNVMWKQFQEALSDASVDTTNRFFQGHVTMILLSLVFYVPLSVVIFVLQRIIGFINYWYGTDSTLASTSQWTWDTAGHVASRAQVPQAYGAVMGMAQGTTMSVVQGSLGAVMLPAAAGAAVLGAGSWYVHHKSLQKMELNGWLSFLLQKLLLFQAQNPDVWHLRGYLQQEGYPIAQLFGLMSLIRELYSWCTDLLPCAMNWLQRRLWEVSSGQPESWKGCCQRMNQEYFDSLKAEQTRKGRAVKAEAEKNQGWIQWSWNKATSTVSSTVSSGVTAAGNAASNLYAMIPKMWTSSHDSESFLPPPPLRVKIRVGHEPVMTLWYQPQHSKKQIPIHFYTFRYYTPCALTPDVQDHVGLLAAELPKQWTKRVVLGDHTLWRVQRYRLPTHIREVLTKQLEKTQRKPTRYSLLESLVIDLQPHYLLPGQSDQHTQIFNDALYDTQRRIIVFTKPGCVRYATILNTTNVSKPILQKSLNHKHKLWPLLQTFLQTYVVDKTQQTFPHLFYQGEYLGNTLPSSFTSTPSPLAFHCGFCDKDVTDLDKHVTTTRHKH
jgi:hypothetical protein